MSIFFRFVSIFLIFSLAVTSPQCALTLSAANVSTFDTTARLVTQSLPFKPLVLCGVRLQDNDPFKLEFIVDEGDTHFNEPQFKEEVSKCIRYFLTGIVVPEKDLWVNLSPQEQNRIIPGGFGVTELGRDLLAQDLFLKEISASLTYPQSESGKAYWNIARNNQADNNQQRVWIVPRTAAVAEDKNGAFIADSRLKAMTEDDYLTRAKTLPPSKGSLAFREHILPLIEQDVNYGKNFAALRQAYNSLILATWFKIRLKESILAQAYADKNVTRGVDIDDPNEKEKIYQQYLEVFKQGSYDYIQRERVSFNHIVKRRYFSGGMDFAGGISSVLHMAPAAGRWSSLIPARGKRVLVGLAALVAVDSVAPLTARAQGDSEHALHRQNTMQIAYDPANQDAVKIVDLRNEDIIERYFPSKQDPFKVISSAPVIAVGTGTYDDGHGVKSVEIKIVRVGNGTAGGYLAFADTHAKKPVIYLNWNAAAKEGALDTSGIAILDSQNNSEKAVNEAKFRKFLRAGKSDGKMAISFVAGQLSHEVEHIQRKAAGKPVVDRAIFAELADYNYSSRISDEGMSYIIEEIAAYLRQITIEPRVQLERMTRMQGHNGSTWMYGVTAKFIVRHIFEALGFEEFVKTHHSEDRNKDPFSYFFLESSDCYNLRAQFISSFSEEQVAVAAKKVYEHYFGKMSEIKINIPSDDIAVLQKLQAGDMELATRYTDGVKRLGLAQAVWEESLEEYLDQYFEGFVNKPQLTQQLLEKLWQIHLSGGTSYYVVNPVSNKQYELWDADAKDGRSRKMVKSSDVKEGDTLRVKTSDGTWRPSTVVKTFKGQLIFTRSPSAINKDKRTRSEQVWQETGVSDPYTLTDGLLLNGILGEAVKDEETPASQGENNFTKGGLGLDEIGKTISIKRNSKVSLVGNFKLPFDIKDLRGMTFNILAVGDTRSAQDIIGEPIL